MKKYTKQAFEPLDKEEKELMDMEERGEFREVSPERFAQLKKELVETAKNSVEARRMISIKIRESDLEFLKREAEKKGLRYQSLINSVLHQYVEGHLKSA
jgi:predicted DNA binding CopG/RHH family protein